MKLARPTLGCLAALILSIGFAAAPAAPAADDTLYKEMGGLEGITLIVNDLSDLYLADDRIKSTFDGVDTLRLKKRLVQQFCMLAGGPCTYKGANMSAVHKGYAITVGQFNALAEDLQIAMDKHNVPYWTQNRFIALLAPMEHDVVTR